MTITSGASTRSSAGRRETRTKRMLYAVGGTGAFLVFTVPLVWAMFRSLQPNEVRSDRAAVRISRFGPASVGTYAPEKQAEITTTVGRVPQLEISISSASRGVRISVPIRAPRRLPWEVT